MVYIDDRMDVVVDVGCVYVDHIEYVDGWFELVEAAGGGQVGEVDCLDDVVECIRVLKMPYAMNNVVDERYTVHEMSQVMSPVDLDVAEIMITQATLYMLSTMFTIHSMVW